MTATKNFLILSLLAFLVIMGLLIYLSFFKKEEQDISPLVTIGMACVVLGMFLVRHPWLGFILICCGIVLDVMGTFHIIKPRK